MAAENKRRDFIKKMAMAGAGASALPQLLLGGNRPQDRQPEAERQQEAKTKQGERKFNEAYTGSHLNRVAFPIGGIGAGMFCLEGTGAISHMSVRNNPEIFSEPAMFAAIHVKGYANAAKVLEGQVPAWK